MPSSTTESRDETQSRCLVRNLRTETRSREEVLRIRVPGQAGKAEQPGNRDVGVSDGDERIGRRRRPGQDGGCSLRRQQHPGLLRLRGLLGRGRPRREIRRKYPQEEVLHRPVRFYFPGYRYRRKHVRPALDEISCPTAAGSQRYTRSMYAPSSVLTLIFSPELTKGGTWTIRPVSVFAGLNEVVTVAFLMLGSVSVTVSTTEGGSSTPIGLSL